MHRYRFVLNKPFIDANSAEEALKLALQQKVLTLSEEKIPVKQILWCSVTPTPGPTGQYSARAVLRADGGDEVIYTLDAPSPERALRALGLNNLQAHANRVYRARFGELYELKIAPSSSESAANTQR